MDQNLNHKNKQKMKKTHVLLSIMLLSSNVLAIKELTASLTNGNWVTSVSATSTNLILKYPPFGKRLMVSYDRWDDTINNITYGPQYNEDLLIATNRVTELYEGWAGVAYLFTPVVFTNKLAGFRVVYNKMLSGEFDDVYRESTNVFHVVLSDIPIEFNENDVEGDLDVSFSQ